jgi:hypothetical protein
MAAYRFCLHTRLPETRSNDQRRENGAPTKICHFSPCRKSKVWTPKLGPLLRASVVVRSTGDAPPLERRPREHLLSAVLAHDGGGGFELL